MKNKHHDSTYQNLQTSARCHLNMRAMHEAMGEDLFVVAVGRARDPEVRDRGIGGQRGDQLGGPVRAGDDGVIVYLNDCFFCAFGCD